MKRTLVGTTMIAAFMMAGSTFAMDSEALQEHMQEIEEKAHQNSEEDRVEALEQQVEDLKELIHKMMEEDAAA